MSALGRMKSPIARRAIAVSACCVFVIAAACANSDASEDSGSTTAAPEKASSPSRVAAASETSADWEKVIAPADCMCSDASAYQFWIHRGSSDRVVFYLEGGGACFSSGTCGPEDPTYKRSLANDSDNQPGEKNSDLTGILDLANGTNPFRDDSIVYVPYCTGDLHQGNTVHDYGDGVVIHHNGNFNGNTALAAAAAVFPAAAEVVVAGGSAGSAATGRYGGLAHDVFPDAKITVIADGSGAYPGTEGITTAIAAFWGSESAIPPWPESADLPTTAWSLPGSFVRAGKHDSTMRIASINTAYDETQARFVKVAGFPDADLMTMIDDNTEFIESEGVEVSSWVGPGVLHTILTRPEFYDTTVEGESLLEWVTALVDGDSVPDVHCKDCQKPA